MDGEIGSRVRSPHLVYATGELRHFAGEMGRGAAAAIFEFAKNIGAHIFQLREFGKGGFSYDFGKTLK